MNKLLISTGLLLLSTLSLKAQDDKQSLTLTQIFASPSFSAQGLPEMNMYQDGTSYTNSLMDNKSGSIVILRYTYDKVAPVDTLLKLSQIKDLPKDFRLESYSFSAGGNLIMFQTSSNKIYRHSAEAQYYIYNLKTKSLQSVLNGKRVFYATISPDEARVAYVYLNNLYVQDLKTGISTPATTDGEINKIINGKSDWVYEEEFVVVKSFAWSPQGDKIAYYRFDESKVKEVILPKYDSLYPTQYKYKYPKVGEDNSKVSIWIYDVKAESKKKLDLHEERDQYIPRIKWTRDNNILSVQRMNRLQNDLELIFADAASGTLQTILEEKSNTYIEITDNLFFLKDNSFLMTSEKEGFDQIYYYDKSGKLIRKLTPGNFDVNEIMGVDEANGIVYYHAQEPGPLVKFIYKVKLDGSGKAPLIANQEGQTNAIFSSNYSWYVLTMTSAAHPMQAGIYDISGKKIRGLVDNTELKDKIAEYKFAEKEFIKIPLSDSLYLNAWMIKPAKMKKGKKYPVMFTIYSGPGSQTVKDDWGGNMDLWYQYLASNGVIVVSVDNRGTGGRGAAFKKVTYKRLGQIESDDMIGAAKWLGTQKYIDAARIGIYGWSFGGYMSSMCLMKGFETFKLAVAVAPVTDWRFYDNIYTERYMQRPSENALGYDQTAVLTYAGHLKGKFLLMHGCFDDNVHPQNSFVLIDQLVKQNKKFDSEFYPNKNHSIYGGFTRLHLYDRVTEFILGNL